ncbi:hypothetical protein niasHS_012742 [Heterodera schachtii]|uniref:Uncharacterized protein n=1 Tax=Heterodera schachtii TaxID=97005 RepID=A0ABD2IGR7_HETSC
MRETMASLARMDDMRLLTDGIERWDVAEELARLVSAEQFGTIPAPLPSFAMFGWLRTDSLRRRREETAAPKRLRLFDNPRVVFRTPPWSEPRGFICGQQSDQTSQREPIGMTTIPP